MNVNNLVTLTFSVGFFTICSFPNIAIAWTHIANSKRRFYGSRSHIRKHFLRITTESAESYQSIDTINNPFNLCIDTLLKSNETNDASVPEFVDGLLLSDLLLEVFGAESVVTTKAKGFALEVHEQRQDDPSTQSLIDEMVLNISPNSLSNDIFGEPDVDYSKDIIHELQQSSPSGRTVSQSIDIPGSEGDGSKKRKVWEYATMIARFPPTSETFVDVSTIISSLEEMMDLSPGSLIYRVVLVKPEQEAAVDWCAHVQKAWPPSLLSENVVAALLFHTDEDCKDVLGVTSDSDQPQYDKIVLEGGSAFGTGDHPTNRLCSEWLLDACNLESQDYSRASPFRVMDYGSGSGILSLVALLAAKRSKRIDDFIVEGVEVDPVAIEASRRNFLLNGYDVPGQAEVYAPMSGAPGSELWHDRNGDSPDDSEGLKQVAKQLPLDRINSYNIVIANILAQPLVSLSKVLALICNKETGRIALCGLMEDQADAVIKAYQPYFDHMRIVSSSRGWVLLEGTRNGVDLDNLK